MASSVSLSFQIAFFVFFHVIITDHILYRSVIITISLSLPTPDVFLRFPSNRRRRVVTVCRNVTSALQW